MEEELQTKLSVFEQQIKQINKQLQIIEQAILDMHTIYLGLDDLKCSKNKVILAPIGRGIFVKAKLISEKLIVNIGENNLVEKDISSTKKIIKEQIEKLEKSRTELENTLKEIDKDLTKVYTEENIKS